MPQNHRAIAAALPRRNRNEWIAFFIDRAGGGDIYMWSDLMKKTILSLVTAAAVGIAGMAATSQPANAVVWWVVPAIVGGAVLGVGVGAAAANSRQPYAYEPQRNIYVEPTADCRVVRQRMDDGRLRRVRVCD
jgi:hypothetical protein